MLGFVFICALLAMLTSSNEFVRLVAGCMVAANLLGLLAGLLVTHVFKMPRDGSYRHAEETEFPSEKNKSQ